MEELTERVFKRAAVQMEYLDTVLDSVAVSKPGNAVYPRSIRPDGTFWESNYKWWCSGFYPGTLWYVYEYTGNETFKELALKYQSGLEPLRYRTDDHDVGFQLMCSYGNCLRLTGDQEMLDHAVAIAEYLLPRVPDDGIPYWDYDAPDIPDDVRDASSAAIMACGLIELSTYVDAEKSARYLALAEKSLRTLASDEYLAAEGEIYGFLLKHSTGNKNRDQEVDVPLTYADYYFLEALMRWQKLVK